MKRGYLNFNFVMLSQANLISEIGTAVYSIAIGFWMLQKTNSTLMMAISSATVYIPKIILGPFVGTFIDRSDKKALLVFTDIMAGVAVALIALAAFGGILKDWMIIVIGLVIGITETIAQPSANVALPMIVSDKDLGRANAAYSATFTSSSIIGRSIGGLLYTSIGAPFVFLINSISYLYSALSESFISKMPGNRKANSKVNFWNDITESWQAVKSIDGLVWMFIIISFLNFFGIMVYTLYMPYFTKTPGLTITLYGMVMACSTAGTLIGQLFFSTKSINKRHYPAVFCGSGIISNLLIVIFPLFTNYLVLSVIILLAGISSAGINIVLNTSLQSGVPKEYHGRVFTFVGMIGGLLIPLGMLVAGFAAEYIKIPFLIFGSGIALVVVFGMAYLSKSVKQFLTNSNVAS